jgi:hypothetical protein
MNVGMIPYLTPILFASSLNKIALSAILDTSVYARAVSNTPGPVSVSTCSAYTESTGPTGTPRPRKKGKLTMPLDLDAKISGLVVQFVEVVDVERGSEEGVAMHCGCSAWSVDA